jgi:hypothetical protein
MLKTGGVYYIHQYFFVLVSPGRIKLLTLNTRQIP